MFVEQDVVDALLVKDEKGRYLMLKANSNPPVNYKVVKTLKDVPIPVINLLKRPRTIGENIELLLEDHSKAKRYVSKLFDYEKFFRDELEKNSQG